MLNCEIIFVLLALAKNTEKIFFKNVLIRLHMVHSIMLHTSELERMSQLAKFHLLVEKARWTCLLLSLALLAHNRI